MTNLTTYEKELLMYVTCSSLFNGDKLNFNEEWNNQKIENGDFFEDIVNVKDYARKLNIEKNAVKGVLSSLVKKDLVSITEDVDSDDKRMAWITINENQFNNIKKILNE